MAERAGGGSREGRSKQLPAQASAALPLLRDPSALRSSSQPTVGVCREPPCLVTEYCQRGSLTDVLAEGRRDPAVAAQLTWHRRLLMVGCLLLCCLRGLAGTEALLLQAC